MARYFSELNETQIGFIRDQKIFFVGSTSPGRDVNISPKGIYPLRVLGKNLIAYLDLFGSGNRTAEDIKDGSGVTIMFCSFGESPLVLRLYCTGEVLYPADSRFDELLVHWRAASRRSVRNIFVFTVNRVHESCGYGVPVFNYISEKKAAEKITVLL